MRGIKTNCQEHMMVNPWKEVSSIAGVTQSSRINYDTNSMLSSKNPLSDSKSKQFCFPSSADPKRISSEAVGCPPARMQWLTQASPAYSSMKVYASAREGCIPGHWCQVELMGLFPPRSFLGACPQDMFHEP